jgi:anti-sigma regulatory factor (Ser/Thr protein kinase)
MTPTERLTIVRIGANEQGLERAAGAYLAFVSRCRVPDDIRVDMYVALDEIVSNLVRHGSPTGPVEITLTLSADTFRIEVVDDGPPFDPTRAPAPDVTLSIDERPTGGLGVLIVMGLTTCSYARVGDRNHVVMQRALTAAP